MTFERMQRDLGKAIRSQREASDLTQEDVAYSAGLNLRNYVEIESGRANPTFLSLCAIAAVLKVPVPRLIPDEVPKVRKGER